jgi:hypothetical protein
MRLTSATQSGLRKSSYSVSRLCFLQSGARDAPFKAHAAVGVPEFRNSFSAKFDK